jgi:hypothetical protein
MLSIDCAERDAIVHEHQIDVRQKPLGWLIGNELRVIQCPKCGEHSVLSQGPRALKRYFVHTGRIVSTTRREKFERQLACCVEESEWSKFIKHGRVEQHFGKIVRVDMTAQIPEEP